MKKSGTGLKNIFVFLFREVNDNCFISRCGAGVSACAFHLNIMRMPEELMREALERLKRIAIEETADPATLRKAAGTLAKFLASRFPASLSNHQVEGYIDSNGALKLGRPPQHETPRHVFGSYQIDCARHVVFRNSVPVADDLEAATAFASDLRHGVFGLLLLFLKERLLELQRQIDLAEKDFGESGSSA